MTSGDALRWHHEFLPGDLGRIVAAHGEVYAREFGWPGAGFEAAAAEGLGTFARTFPERSAAGWDRLWVATTRAGGGDYAGSVAVQETVPGQTAHLRWLLVVPAARRTGLGRRLATAVVDRSRARGLTTVRLFTTSKQTAAIGLYRQLGFVKVSEEPHDGWGFPVMLERYELTL